MHVYFVDILLTQFLTYSFVNSLLFEVGHFHVRLGTLKAHVRNDYWHLWVGGGFWCLGHDIWFKTLAIGLPKVPLLILYHPGKLFRGSWPKVKDTTFQVIAPTLEVGLGSRLWTLGFGPSLLTSVLLGLVCLPTFFQSRHLTYLFQMDEMVYFRPSPSLFFKFS